MALTPPPKKKVIISFWQLDQFLSTFEKNVFLPLEKLKTLSKFAKNEVNLTACRTLRRVGRTLWRVGRTARRVGHMVCWPYKTLMGPPGGPEGPSRRGGGTTHEKFLWSRIA